METEISVDELTLVLQLDRQTKPTITAFDWQDCAEYIASLFAKQANFEQVFGDQRTQMRPPLGYTIAYTYGDHNFYFAVAYHQYHKDMGVCVKFSAQALNFYCERSGLKVYSFLQAVKSKNYTMRLSRIDICVDIFDNEEIDVTSIYQGFINNKIGVFREHHNKNTDETEFRRVNVTYTGILKGSEVQSIYVGSASSMSRLCAYNKKYEQIQKKGVHFDRAKKCASWTRFEIRLKNCYSHTMTEALLGVKSDQEYSDLLASVLIQKFRLMYIADGVVDCDTEYIQLLLDVVKQRSIVLKSSSSKNYDLIRSLHHLFYGSGVISTMYKIKEVWGLDAMLSFSDHICGFVNDWTPNPDTRYWLDKNKSDHLHNFPNFNKYMHDVIIPYTYTKWGS